LDFIGLASFFMLAQVRFGFKHRAAEIALEFGNFTRLRRIRSIGSHSYLTPRSVIGKADALAQPSRTLSACINKRQSLCRRFLALKQ
jgi:hypothetical protein